MKTQHTPGPWHIEKHSKPVWQESGGPGNVTYAQIVPITLIVHEQLGDPRLRTCVCQLDNSTESDSNARLIATAPELLEACNRLIECQHEQDTTAFYTRYDTAAQQARAAIAKATGEKP